MADKVLFLSGLSKFKSEADTLYASKSYVTSEITSAISGVTQFDYQIVSELPESGTKGIIYLVPNSGFGSNLYDEYIWIVSGEPAVGSFELFGTKELTVVEYVGDGTYVTVTDGTGAQAGKKVVSLSSAAQASLALADSALQALTSSTLDVTGAGTTKNLEVASSIVSGAAAGATALQGVSSTGSTVTISGDGTTKNLEVAASIQTGAAAGATAIQALTSSTLDVSGTGTTKTVEVSSTIVNGAAAGATALQPGAYVAITDAEIEALFE